MFNRILIVFFFAASLSGSAQTLTQLQPSGNYRPVKMEFDQVKSPQVAYQLVKQFLGVHTGDSLVVTQDVANKMIKLRVRHMDVIVERTSERTIHFDIAYQMWIKMDKTGLRVMYKEFEYWDNERGWRDLDFNSFHPVRDKSFLDQLDAVVNRMVSDLYVYVKEESKSGS